MSRQIFDPEAAARNANHHVAPHRKRRDADDIRGDADASSEQPTPEQLRKRRELAARVRPATQPSRIKEQPVHKEKIDAAVTAAFERVLNDALSAHACAKLIDVYFDDPQDPQRAERVERTKAVWQNLQFLLDTPLEAWQISGRDFLGEEFARINTARDVLREILSRNYAYLERNWPRPHAVYGTNARMIVEKLLLWAGDYERKGFAEPRDQQWVERSNLPFAQFEFELGKFFPVLRNDRAADGKDHGWQDNRLITRTSDLIRLFPYRTVPDQKRHEAAEQARAEIRELLHGSVAQ